MRPIPTGATRERRKREAADGATPTADTCHEHKSTLAPRSPHPPSVGALLPHAGAYSHSVCEPCVSACACTVRETGHAFDHRSRAHLDGLRSLLVLPPQVRHQAQRQLKDGGLLIHSRPYTRSVDEAHMRPAAYAVDGGCKACKRPTCTHLCAPGLCKVCGKQVNTAHHQWRSCSSEEVGGELVRVLR